MEVEEIEDAAFDLIEEEKMEESYQLCLYGLKLHPEDETIEMVLAWLMMQTKRISEAEQLIAKYKDYQGEDIDIILRLRFQLEVFKGHHHQALTNYLPLLKNHEMQGDMWVQAINEVYSEFSPEVLTPYLVMAMEFMTDVEAGWGQLGGMLMDLEDYQHAVTCLNRAIDINAYNVYSWQDLVRCYMFLQDTEKCLEACEMGLAIDPKNADINFVYGFILYHELRYKEAIPPLEIARQYAEGKLKSDDFVFNKEDRRVEIDSIYSLLGNSYREIKDMDKAIECLSIACERNPAEVTNITTLSAIYLERGALDSALATLDAGLKIAPLKVPLLAIKVSILATMHRYDEALAILNEILELKPREKIFLLTKAQMLKSIGRMEEADACFRELLEKNPRSKFMVNMLIHYFESINDEEALKKLKTK